MRLKISLFAMIFTVMVLAACNPAPHESSTTPTAGGRLTPYSTATNTPTITPTPVNAPTATLAPTATPTPRIYVVKEKDTLAVIAYRNGLTVDELKAANPKVDPYMMPVGTELIIPLPRTAALTPAAGEPTQVPVQVNPVDCSPAATGGLYCFAVVENQQQITVSNFSAEFQLTDPSTGTLTSQKALLPLETLEPGASLPLYAYFPPTVPNNPQVELKVLTSSGMEAPAASGIEMKEPEIQISADGFSAAVSGAGVYTDAASSRKALTITAVSFDAGGKVNGIRRIELPIDTSSSSEVNYSLNVYSSRGTIAKVLVFADTRP